LPPFREVISAYQKCIAETVQRFGGFVAKYMGDGVLVYFGYPQAHEDDAERAVRAGLELVIGTSTNTQRRARLEEFGCDLALDSNNPSWPEQARKATADNGVDVIVDMISGSVADQNLQAAAVLGRIVNVGRLGGITGTFNFELHAFKRIDYIGVTFRTRSLDEIRAISRLMRADLWPAVQAGKLTMPICRTLQMARDRMHVEETDACYIVRDRAG
jgi:NADPH:quinone reductase-like Zn-dependent oxidoreductase